MASIKIHGAKLSTCTKRVATVCIELGLNYEIVEIDYKNNAHKSPEYLENFHPFGIVPVLEDTDGTKIYESRAIARYLTAKYGKGSSLLPLTTDVKAYGLFEQAASVEYSSFDPSASGLTTERVFQPRSGKPVNEALATHHETNLKAKLEGYERVLSKQKYLAGDYITLADLFHLPYGSFVNKIDPTIIGSNPNVKRWWDDISSREAWKSLN